MQRGRTPALHGVARVPVVLSKVVVWVFVLCAFPAAVHHWSSDGRELAQSSHPALPSAGAVAVPAFGSCHALHVRYPGGVARPGAHNSGRALRPSALVRTSKPLYVANKSLDTDHDGLACERVRTRGR
jgi:Excalibur calcium-binding domain